MNHEELVVWMGSERLGVLRRVSTRDLELSYSEEWINKPVPTPLSVALPLAGRTFRGQRLVSWLWGLLPDNDRVIARWAATAQCSASDVFGLLGLVGHDVAGAVRFLPPETAASGRAGLVALTNDEIGAHIGELRRDSALWHPTDSGRWSLAGAQPKLALAYDQARATWGFPTGPRPTTHIVKPGVAGLHDHHVNEHLCLSAAAGLGLRSAKSSIVQFGTERALVVSRYDRVTRGRAVVRVHQEDCCQALGVHPGRKYQSEGGPSAEDIVTLIRSSVLTKTADDVMLYLLSLGFNWLVLGTDGHAKNWSLLLSGAQVRVAPLYDLASALPYDSHPKKLRLAQKIGGEYAPTKIARRHWERLAMTSRVDTQEFLSRLTTMADAIGDTFTEARQKAELNARERRTAAGLVDRVARWSQLCRKRL
jgi:serine/threonine-protein kinase HipA